MKKIKLFVRTYKTKDGREFSKISILGKYLPLVDAKDDTWYTVKFTGEVKEPTKEGQYVVGYEKNGLWIDSRETQLHKNIVRIRAVKVVFDDKLPEKVDENGLE